MEREMFGLLKWDGSIASLVLFPSWRLPSLLLEHPVALDHAGSGNVSSDHLQSSSGSAFTLSGWMVPWLIIMVAWGVGFSTWNVLHERFHDRLREQSAASNTEILALKQQNDKQQRKKRNQNQELDALHSETTALKGRTVDASTDSQWTTRQDSLKQEAVTPGPATKIDTATQTEGHETPLEEKIQGNEHRICIQERDTDSGGFTSRLKAAPGNDHTNVKTPLTFMENTGNGSSVSTATPVKLLHVCHPERQSVGQDQTSPTPIPSSPNSSTTDNPSRFGEPAANGQRFALAEQTVPGQDQLVQTALSPPSSPSTKDSGVMAVTPTTCHPKDGDEGHNKTSGDDRATSILPRRFRFRDVARRFTRSGRKEERVLAKKEASRKH